MTNSKRKSKEVKIYSHPLVEIQNMSDGFYSVKIWAATEIYFEVSSKDYDNTLKQICRVIPHMIKLDGDLMEMMDDAGRTQLNQNDINVVRHFATMFSFRNVSCALPGFERMQ